MWTAILQMLPSRKLVGRSRPRGRGDEDVRSIYAHGGVSGVAQTRPVTVAPSLSRGLEASDAVGAVETVVRALEDDPALNAGYGAVLTRSGSLELDAGIADGAAQRSGAVTGVRVRHPISLARRVMEATPHVLMAGPGAEALGPGMERLSGSTPERHDQWATAIRDGSIDRVGFAPAEEADTVGAVALDDAGRLAAGSSTGGVFGQMAGRVGDSPIFGAGFYASPSAAVVGTGVGELFAETLACLRTGSLIEEGASPQEACEAMIAWLGSRRPTSAGLLALDVTGRAGAAYRGASWTVDGALGALEPRRLP